MENQSPFSGGGGSNTEPTTVPKSLFDLFAQLNSKASTKYIVDPDGLNMEISFSTSGICTIKSKDTTLAYPFKKA